MAIGNAEAKLPGTHVQKILLPSASRSFRRRVGFTAGLRPGVSIFKPGGARLTGLNSDIFQSARQIPEENL